MPAPQQTRAVGGTALNTPAGQQVFAGIAASPTGGVRQAGLSSTTEGLLRGLNLLTPVVEDTLAKREGELREEGRNFARGGGGRAEADAKPKSFLSGYLEGLGEAAAINDRSALIESYHTSFNKDDGDIESFIGEFYQHRMKEGGITPEFKSAYDASFAKAADQLRGIHGEAVAANIIDTNRAAAQLRLDDAVGQAFIDSQFAQRQAGNRAANGLPDGGWSNEKPLGAALIERWQQIATDQRIPRKDRNEMLFLSLMKYSQQGHPEVWEAAKVQRIDPETGQRVDALYSIPEFKQRIDQAEAAARNIRDNAQEREDKKAEKDLKERQDVAMRDVLDSYYAGDQDAAMTTLRRLRSDRTLFPNASDLINLEKLVRGFGEDLRAPEWEDREVELMLEIQEGGVSERDILNEDIGRLNKRRLLSYLRTVDTDRRRDARDAARASKSEEDALRSKMVQADLRFIEESLPDPKTIADVMGEEAAAARMDVAEIKRRFTSIVFENPGMDYRARRELAQRLVEEVQARREARQDSAAALVPQSPFQTYQELVEALDDSRITPADFVMYKSRLDAYYGKQNGKP